MNHARIDAALVLGAAFFALVSAMLFTPLQTFTLAIALLALLVASIVVRAHRRPR